MATVIKSSQGQDDTTATMMKAMMSYMTQSILDEDRATRAVKAEDAQFKLGQERSVDLESKIATSAGVIRDQLDTDEYEEKKRAYVNEGLGELLPTPVDAPTDLPEGVSGGIEATVTPEQQAQREKDIDAEIASGNYGGRGAPEYTAFLNNQGKETLSQMRTLYGKTVNEHGIVMDVAENAKFEVRKNAVQKTLQNSIQQAVKRQTAVGDVANAQQKEISTFQNDLGIGRDNNRHTNDLTLLGKRFSNNQTLEGTRKANNVEAEKTRFGNQKLLTNYKITQEAAANAAERKIALKNSALKAFGIYGEDVYRGYLNKDGTINEFKAVSAMAVIDYGNDMNRKETLAKFDGDPELSDNYERLAKKIVDMTVKTGKTGKFGSNMAFLESAVREQRAWRDSLPKGSAELNRMQALIKSGNPVAWETLRNERDALTLKRIMSYTKSDGGDGATNVISGVFKQVYEKNPLVLAKGTPDSGADRGTMMSAMLSGVDATIAGMTGFYRGSDPTQEEQFAINQIISFSPGLRQSLVTGLVQQAELQRGEKFKEGTAYNLPGQSPLDGGNSKTNLDLSNLNPSQGRVAGNFDIGDIAKKTGDYVSAALSGSMERAPAKISGKGLESIQASLSEGMSAISEARLAYKGVKGDAVTKKAVKTLVNGTIKSLTPHPSAKVKKFAKDLTKTLTAAATATTEEITRAAQPAIRGIQGDLVPGGIASSDFTPTETPKPASRARIVKSLRSFNVVSSGDRPRMKQLIAAADSGKLNIDAVIRFRTVQAQGGHNRAVQQLDQMLELYKTGKWAHQGGL